MLKNLEIKKILAIRNDKIGDLVLSINSLVILKKEFPNAKIDMVVSKENFPLIEKNKSINKIYILNYSPRTLKEFISYWNLAKKIRDEKYDLGVELRGSFFNILFLLFFGRVKYRIGYYTNPLSKIFLDYGHLKDFKGHASVNMIKMINHGLKRNYNYHWPEIRIDNLDKKELKDFMKKNRINRFISLCVDASNEEKQWPPENFDKLIKYLYKNYPPYKIMIIGVDDKKVNYLLERNNFCIPIIKKNLRFIYLLFKKSSLVIAPDGGLMHLAWTSKTNLIALIPSNLPLEDIKPLGKNSHIIFKDLKKIKLIEVVSLIKKIL